MEAGLSGQNQDARAGGSSGGGGVLRVCHVGTRCGSMDELLAALGPHVDATTIFVPSRIGLEVGEVVRLEILLADRTVGFSGLVKVKAVDRQPIATHGRPGALFEIQQLDEPSRALHRQMLRRQREGAPGGVPAHGLTTRPSASPGTSGVRPSPAASPAAATGADEDPNPFAEISTNAIDVFVEATFTEGEPTAVTQPLALRPAKPAAFFGLPVPEPQDRHPGRTTLLGRPIEPAPPLKDLSPAAIAPTMMAPTSTVSPRSLPPLPASSGAPRAPSGTRPPVPIPPVVVTPTPGPISPPARVEAVVEIEEMASAELQTLLTPAAARWRWMLGGLRRFLHGLFAPVRALLRPLGRFWPAAVALPLGLAGVLLFTGPFANPVIEELAPPTPLAALAPAPPPPPPPLLPVAEQPTSPAPTPAPTPAAAEAPAAGAPCTATVDSTPAAEVTVAGKRLGRTPLRAAVVPCGSSPLVIRHPRYRVVSQSLRASPGAPAAVDVRLERPEARLRLSSSPAGALFKINGQAVGRGPRTVTVPRFESVRVEATLANQKPWRRTLYVRAPVTAVSARLGR